MARRLTTQQRRERRLREQARLRAYLLEWLQITGLKQCAVAVQAGMSTGCISMILSGKRQFTLTTWCDIVDAVEELKRKVGSAELPPHRF